MLRARLIRRRDGRFVYGLLRFRGQLRSAVQSLGSTSGIGNLYGITLGYWIWAKGAEAAPVESTTMFMFVPIGNAVTTAILGKALWPEGGEEE